MANTVMLNIDETDWVLIATATNGFVTNESRSKILYRESDVDPQQTDKTAHTLEIAEGAFFSFKLNVGQSLYMRSTDGVATIAVTVD